MTTLPSAIADKAALDTAFTSTGAKLFQHQEAMQSLRDGSGKPISAWCAPTDVCNHRCAFCSVGERSGDMLRFEQIKEFIDQLVPLGLKSITFSGGGNPLIYRCKESGATIETVIEYAYNQGLEVAMITNGMPLADYPWVQHDPFGGRMPSVMELAKLPSEIKFPRFLSGNRRSWRNLSPRHLDMLTWCRISMSGLDHNHKEQEVYVPDFDPSKTALGFSWIMSDSYEEPTHKHGWVSTPEDVKTPGGRFVDALDRLDWVEDRIKHYVEVHNPRYVRLLTNCLQPERIPERHKFLQDMANRINPEVVFSQNKPPYQPKKCFKVLTRPCLNADGWVYPCDSVVLNKTAGHKFDSAWRICRGEQVGELFADPSKFAMPENICPGCVFADQVNMINDVVKGMATPLPDGPPPEHYNFV